MKIPIIPRITDKDLQLPIIKLSPSTFTRFRDGCVYQCILSRFIKNEVDSKSFEITFNLSNPSNLLGNIIHKLLELRVEGLIVTEQDFIEKWEELIRQKMAFIKEHFPTLKSIDLSDYDKMYKALDVTMSIQPNKFNNNEYPIINGFSIPKSTELWIDGVDSIHGQIDRILINDDSIEILDYKTGIVHDALGNIKETYITQLNLYALLFEKRFNRPVTKLTILDFDGNRINVPLFSGDFDKIFILVKELLMKINMQIESMDWDNLSKPSPVNCKWCSCRPLCHYYWNSANQSDSDFEGNVTTIINNDVLEMEDEHGNFTRIRGLRDYQIEDFNTLKNRILRFHNIFSINNEMPWGRLFTTTKNTIIYEVIK